FFFLSLLIPPLSTLFPYTTLFRSTRRDVVVVSSVSCIYGLGTPQEYVDRMVQLEVGDELDRDELLTRFVDMQYDRNDVAFERGRSEEHTSELQSRFDLVCRLLLEK